MTAVFARFRWRRVQADLQPPAPLHLDDLAAALAWRTGVNLGVVKQVLHAEHSRRSVRRGRPPR